jgi:spore photoproduct lyase
MHTFTPDKVFYEPATENYELGRELLARYGGMGIPLAPIESHNKIPELRARPAGDFAAMKRHLVLGVRKSLTHQPNHKTSDFLVPWTSSGCAAMCLYCYLVCTYFTSAYLRVFVNREAMMAKLLRAAGKADRDLVFEIGSNSDLVLENAVTGSLAWTIEQFSRSPKGRLTLPTKFDMVEALLPLDHRGKTTFRMSLNPEEMIRKIEFGTAGLDARMAALAKLYEAGYPVGILVAPLMLLDGWQGMYGRLFERMADTLPRDLLKAAPLELIFMTYGYAHRQINPCAFPGVNEPYDARLMAPCGRGRSGYKKAVKEEASAFLREKLAHYFPETPIAYIV